MEYIKAKKCLYSFSWAIALLVLQAVIISFNSCCLKEKNFAKIENSSVEKDTGM